MHDRFHLFRLQIEVWQRAADARWLETQRHRRWPNDGNQHLVTASRVAGRHQRDAIFDRRGLSSARPTPHSSGDIPGEVDTGTAAQSRLYYEYAPGYAWPAPVVSPPCARPLSGSGSRRPTLPPQRHIPQTMPLRPPLDEARPCLESSHAQIGRNPCRLGIQHCQQRVGRSWPLPECRYTKIEKPCPRPQFFTGASSPRPGPHRHALALVGGTALGARGTVGRQIQRYVLQSCRPSSA